MVTFGDAVDPFVDIRDLVQHAELKAMVDVTIDNPEAAEVFREVVST